MKRQAASGKRQTNRVARRSAPKRGSVFILTLAILIALVGLVATLAETNREFAMSQWNRMADRRARLMVEAGVQRAVSELQQQDLSRATLSDHWATLGDKGEDSFTLNRDSFRLQVFDLGSRVNANAADEGQLKDLSLTQEQIDSLIDWREQGASPRPQGAKDDFYNRLQNPYSAKQKPLSSLDELLQVRGFSPDALFRTTGQSGPLNELFTVDSASADEDVGGKQKIDINSATQDQLVEIGVPQDLAAAIIQARSGGFKKMADALAVQNMTRDAARTLADNTAIGSDALRTGLINLNTAPEAVLASVPDLSDEQAKAILDHQHAGFRSIGELLDLPGMEVSDFAKVVDRFCVSSRAFLARVVGTAANRHEAAEAILTLDDNGEVTIKRVQPVLYPYVRDVWGWPENPSQSISLGVGP